VHEHIHKGTLDWAAFIFGRVFLKVIFSTLDAMGSMIKEV